MSNRSKLEQSLAGHLENFISDLNIPAQVQLEVLLSILDQNKSTLYGQQHDFKEIKDVATYRQKVPVCNYETISQLILRMSAGESELLTAQQVLAFEETGGSNDGRKLIPYTSAGLKAFQHGLLPWLNDLCVHMPGLCEGRFYWAISPACREQRVLPSGISVGLNDAAYFGPETGAAVADMLAVPAKASLITDVDRWRIFTLTHLFCCEDLSLISVWSPTFLTELLRYASMSRDNIFENMCHIAETTDSTILQRAQLIAHELGQNKPDFLKIWPKLKVISCWDQASAARSAEQLRQLFPGVLVQGKGLLATEGLVTIPLVNYSHPVVSLRSGFFEFIDNNENIMGIDQLDIGQEYRLLLTTHSGLYRYDIGDKVLVRGFAGKTPTLEFIGRSCTVSDLCGEKLIDAFVSKCLAIINQKFAMLAPEKSPATEKMRYVLILDADAVDSYNYENMATIIDHALQGNPQYAYARELGQLDPVTALLCRNPLASWIRERQRCGQRLGDIKIPALLNDFKWRNWALPSNNHI